MALDVGADKLLISKGLASAPHTWDLRQIRIELFQKKVKKINQHSAQVKEPDEIPR